MTSENIDSSLNCFLKIRGKSLADRGSAEFAVSRADALIFMQKLKSAKKRPLGMEVWRLREGKFRIDSLGGWYAEFVDETKNYEDAMDFLCNVELADEDVITVQF